MIDFVLRNIVELASLPGSVPKLRSFILDQAVRGNLTADWRREHPENDPASVLLERIPEEKRELVKAGKIKKQKELSPVDSEEVPFGVPEGWEWVRLVKIVRIGPQNGLSPRRSDNPNDPRAITLSATTKGTFDSAHYKNIAVAPADAEPFWLRPGDLLFQRGNTREYVGMAAIYDGPDESFLFPDLIIRVGLFGSADVRYVHRVAVSRYGRGYFSSKASGTSETMPKINQQVLNSFPLPLPPTDEQTEIVHRVDELMALCDQLEAVQTRRDDTRRRALTAGATQLTDATTNQPFTDIWPRFTARLPELVQHPDDIKPVQDAILQLAVRGHLTADWRASHSDTEPASTLIARIKEEKQAMVRSGKIKKQKELLPVDPEEVPFAVPEGWEWVRLGILTTKIGSGSTPRGGKAAYVTEGVPFIRSQNVWNEGLRTDSIALIPEVIHQQMSGTHVQNGDVLYNITGASIGRSCLFPDSLQRANVSQHVSIVRPVIRRLARHVHLTFISPFFFELTMNQQVGMSREGLSNAKLSMSPVPLAPVPEQTEIVRHVDALMTLCDQLASKHRDRASHAEKLLTTALRTAG